MARQNVFSEVKDKSLYLTLPNSRKEAQIALGRLLCTLRQQILTWEYGSGPSSPAVSLSGFPYSLMHLRGAQFPSNSCTRIPVLDSVSKGLNQGQVHRRDEVAMSGGGLACV